MRFHRSADYNYVMPTNLALTVVQNLCQTLKGQCQNIENVLRLYGYSPKRNHVKDFCRCPKTESIDASTGGVNPNEEYGMLLGEVEKVLLKASVVCPTECNSTNSAKKLKDRSDFVKLGDACQQNRTESKAISEILLKPTNSMNATRMKFKADGKVVSYKPAHLRAPFRTERCTKSRKTNVGKCSIMRNCPSNQSTTALSTSAIDKGANKINCRISPEKLPPIPIPSPAEYDSSPVVFQNPSQHRSPDHKLLSQLKDIYLPEEPFPCFNEFRIAMQKEFFRNMIKLKCVLSPAQWFEGTTKRDDFIRFHYDVCESRCDLSTLSAILINKYRLVTDMLDTFINLLHCVDAKLVTSNQFQWITSMTTRFTETFHLLRFASEHLRSKQSDSFIQNNSNHELHEPDDLLQNWLSLMKADCNGHIKQTTLNDSLPVKAYFTMGVPSAKSIFSRLFLLSRYSSHCAFKGNSREIEQFLDLWHLLADEEIRQTVLQACAESLPEILNELGNCTVNRASLFRQLYGLISGSCPVALKDNFDDQ